MDSTTLIDSSAATYIISDHSSTIPTISSTTIPTIATATSDTATQCMMAKEPKKEDTTASQTKPKRTRRKKQSIIEWKDLIEIESKWNLKLFLDKKDLTTYIKCNWYVAQTNAVDMNKIRESFEILEKVSIDTSSYIFASNTDYKMWDTVLLYWPTGTGKTHTCIDWSRRNNIPYEMVVVSDWFEEIDFLSYIVPTSNGIQYKEKNVIWLLRLASQWNKVCLIIDEVNRWSKSFMNFLLKLIDPVTWYYEVNNFINDEIIRISPDNIIFFCTANLWWQYEWVNAIDAALFDRFSRTKFVDYDDKLEETIINNFWEFKKSVKKIIEDFRMRYKDNSLARPLSTRSIKNRCTYFLNTNKTKEDLFQSFEETILYKLSSIDSFWFVSQEDVSALVQPFYSENILSKVKESKEEVTTDTSSS